MLPKRRLKKSAIICQKIKNILNKFFIVLQKLRNKIMHFIIKDNGVLVNDKEVFDHPFDFGKNGVSFDNVLNFFNEVEKDYYSIKSYVKKEIHISSNDRFDDKWDLFQKQKDFTARSHDISKKMNFDKIKGPKEKINKYIVKHGKMKYGFNDLKKWDEDTKKLISKSEILLKDMDSLNNEYSRLLEMGSYEATLYFNTGMVIVQPMCSIKQIIIYSQQRIESMHRYYNTLTDKKVDNSDE